MDSELGRAVASIRTSNQWTVLSGIVNKVNKKLGRVHSVSSSSPLSSAGVTAKELAAFLHGLDAAELSAHGVWIDGFGQETIVCVNPAFGRAMAAGAAKQCSCGATTAEHAEASTQRYFRSQDYNAGRHAVARSVHQPSCLLWTPPTASHLHSWRRNYTDP